MTQKWYDDMEMTITIPCGFCGDTFTHEWATDSMQEYTGTSHWNIPADINIVMEEQGWDWSVHDETNSLVPICEECNVS